MPLYIGILNAEGLPNCFEKYSSTRFFSRGFTGNMVLLLWSVMGTLLALAFMSTIRVMLFSPVYEKPIDSTKDVILSGKIPILGHKESLWPEYFRTSANKWDQKASEIGRAYDGGEHEKKLRRETYMEGKYSICSSFGAVSYSIITDPWYANKTPPYFQISKEPLNPYYHGWIYPKVSKWKKDIDRHILSVQQVKEFLF